MRVFLLSLVPLVLLSCQPQPAPTPPTEVTYASTPHWPAPSDFGGLQPGTLITTNSGEDSVSFLSRDDGHELFRAPMGLFPMQLEGPHHMVVDPQKRALFIPISNYVPGSGSGPHGSHGTGRVPGYLLRINAQSLLLEGQVVIDRSPGDVISSPDGSTIYVSHYDLVKVQEVLARGGTPEEMASTVAVVDAQTMQRRALVPTCAAAHGMAISQDGKKLYVSCALTDELAIMDLTVFPPSVTKVPIAATPAHPPDAVHEPYAVSVQPGTGRVFISLIKSQKLAAYDPVAGTMTLGPRYDASPMFTAFTSDGSKLLVPIRESAQLVEVDATTLEASRPLLQLSPDVCQYAHGIHVAADDQTAWMVCEGDKVAPGTVVAILPAILAVAWSVPVGVFPDTIVEVP